MKEVTSLPTLPLETPRPPTSRREWSGNTNTAQGTMGREMAGRDTKEYVCGWGAACINIMVTFPMNKVMFRQQLYGVRFWKALGQIQKEGLSNVYRGLLPPLMQKSVSVSIMFGTYFQYQRLLHNYFPELSVTSCKAGAAMLSGCTEAILLPFERVQTLLQDRTYHKHLNNTFHAFVELRGYGLREYYRGLSAVVVRNSLSNVMFFLLRDKIKLLMVSDSYLPGRDHRTDFVTDFISGGILGAMISTVFFPVNVVKTKMQSRLGGDFVPFQEAFKQIYEERNGSWRKIFRGVHLNYTRSMISWGIINASYEVLKKLLSAGHE